MRAKEYPLLVDALEVAARRATNRTLKHMDKDSLRDPMVQAKVEEEFVECALTEICERFELDTPDLESRLEDVVGQIEKALANHPKQGQPPQDGQEDDECQSEDWCKYNL